MIDHIKEKMLKFYLHDKFEYNGKLTITFSKSDHLFHVKLCGGRFEHPNEWSGRFDDVHGPYYQGMQIYTWLKTNKNTSDWDYRVYQHALKSTKF